MPRARSIVTVLLLVPLLAASNCKHSTPDEIIDKGDGPTPADVKTELLTVSLRPSVVAPGEALEASIFGAGFDPGAVVVVSGQQLGEVQFIDDNTLGWSLPGLDAGTYDVSVRNPDGTDSTLFGGLSVRDTSGDCDVVRVFFALDKAGLTDPAKSLLDSKLSCYQGSRGQLTVSGHADERGTTDYNLALGQRRANTVRRYLLRGGLPASRATTVSYGEERPLQRGHDEAAYAQNRRAEVRLGQ